jgi:hypothetical protein
MINFLDIIYQSHTYDDDLVLETGLSPSSGKKPTLLGPFNTANPYLDTRSNVRLDI